MFSKTRVITVLVTLGVIAALNRYQPTKEFLAGDSSWF